MTSLAKVLVVDDDKPTRDFVVEALQDEDYLVEATKDAQQALAAIESDDYDVILLDLRMPGIDGADLFHILYERGLVTMPIILMTADNRSLQELVSQGVKFILFKPFDLDTLLNCISEALRDVQDTQKQGSPAPDATMSKEVHICT